MDRRDPRERRSNTQGGRSKVILFGMRNIQLSLLECLEALCNQAYLLVIVLLKSQPTTNFRRGIEYIYDIQERSNIIWYDGSLMEVTVAMDYVNGRRFALYKLSARELMVRWFWELFMATYSTLDQKIYGVMYNKIEEQLFLLIRLPEDNKESLGQVLRRNLYDDLDMSIIKEVTERLFAEISRYHSQGIANLGITVDTVYVIQGSFTGVVFGDISRPVFEEHPTFEQAKVRDVGQAREIILQYMNRFGHMTPLYYALLPRNLTAINIVRRIQGVRITQEVSHDIATDLPSFVNWHGDSSEWYPRSLLGGQHQLPLSRADRTTLETPLQTQPDVTGFEGEPANMLQTRPPVRTQSVNPDSSPPPTESKSLKVQPHMEETEGPSPLSQVTEELSADQTSVDQAEIPTDQEDLVTDGARSYNQGQNEAAAPMATGIPPQNVDSGVNTWESPTDVADAVDEDLPPD